jgi:hypothetical protein
MQHNPTKCKHCGGTGERAICYDESCIDRSGCGDCLDECPWCFGFGWVYPKGTVRTDQDEWRIH